MIRSTLDINIFDLSVIDQKDAVLFHYMEGDETYIYIGNERFNIPENTLAVSRHGEFEDLSEKFVGIKFKQDVRMEGLVAVMQHDASYMVCFATPEFSGLNGEDAVNDVLLLRVGNALVDIGE